MGSIEILSSSSTRKTQTERKHEVLPGHRSDCPFHPGDGILRTLLQPLPTLQKCLQQPCLRLEVLHPGGCRHSRRTDRGGHQRPGPLTIFAPTNEAFAKIPSDALAGLLEDVPALTEILLRHVVPKNIVKLYKAEMSYDNAGGSKVMVDGYSVATSAASAKVIAKVRATDGIVYAIDTVV